MKIIGFLCALGLLSAVAIAGTANAGTVTLNGVVSASEKSNVYTSSAQVRWFNDHENTQFGLGSESFNDGRQTMEVRYGVGNLATDTGPTIEEYFFLAVTVPLAAKNMAWGTGASDFDIVRYQQQFSHHDKEELTNDPAKHDKTIGGKKQKYFDFEKATGSELIAFGDVVGKLVNSSGVAATGGKVKKAKTAKKAKKAKKTKGAAAPAPASAAVGSDLIAVKSSVDYLLMMSICDVAGCDKSDTPLSMEFQFGLAAKDDLIAYLTGGDAAFRTHLSPELGGVLIREMSPVPGPAALPLLLTGLLGLGVMARRRKKLAA